MKALKGILIAVAVAILIWCGCTYISKLQNSKDNSKEDYWAGEITGVFSEGITTSKGNFTIGRLAKSADIDSLEISVGAGKCIIKESNDDYYHLSAETDLEYKYGTENGKIYIECKTEKINFGTKNNTLTLEIPKSAKLKNADLSFGACECSIDELVVEDKVIIQVGAGSLTMNKVVASDIDAEIGAGGLIIKDIDSADATIELGMGNTELKGTISGNLDVKCGMGNVSFDTSDAMDKHNYKLKCSMGSVEVFDTKYSSLSDTKTIDNGVDSTYDVECSMGNVTIF